MMKNYIAESADVTGQVFLSDGVNIWNHATLRGDVAAIRIGENSNIQDNVVIHGSIGQETVVGKNVTVGHSAILHGCTICDGVLVGMGSIILDAAVVGPNCLIGAGTLISSGKNIPAGKLVFGNPARIIRDLTEDEIANLQTSVDEYLHLSGLE